MKERVALKFGAARRYSAVCLSAALAISSFPNAADAASGIYAGVFAGAADVRNRIVDVDGFSNWGNPGYIVDYDDPGFAGGVLVGKRFEGLPVRIEIDAGFADLSVDTKGLDPAHGDETAASTLRWFATARAGVEHVLGPATVVATAGLAAAQIESSVTDLDRELVDGMPTPWRMDPDDSFHDRLTKIGWVIGIGVETALADAWTLRLVSEFRAEQAHPQPLRQQSLRSGRRKESLYLPHREQTRSPATCDHSQIRPVAEERRKPFEENHACGLPVSSSPVRSRSRNRQLP